MARDLNKARDNSVDEHAEVTGRPRTQTVGDLAGELASDTYSIVVALGILSLSYWVLFRSLPVELFTLGLAATVLVAVNAVVTVRRWQT